MISGIGWVSELIEIAGGRDVFTDRAVAKGAKERIVSSEEVIRAAPEVIIASWCGKKVRPERIAARPRWDGIPRLTR
jgi:iron complex transport system substrate-binding protein